ncbi:MAG: glycosyltransferase family 2 protein [Candidatus Bathyarchaeota archaeon]|nr:glycosyltransferase family 2 protein [Candidatus Bathyarchaeota archaeon]
MDGKVDRLFHSNLVLIAALNEETGIGLTISEFKQYLPDSVFLVVDGNSSDNTAHVAASLGAKVVYQTGRGKGNALSQGLQHIGSTIDYVILTDADYTYPAVFVPKMLQILYDDPRIGMVCGNRFNSHFGLKGMADLFYFGNRALAFAHNMLNGINLRDPLTGLRVVRSEILKKWKPKSESFDIEVELNHVVERQGYHIMEIPISYRSRIGEKKLKPKHGFEIFRRMLTESI